MTEAQAPSIYDEICKKSGLQEQFIAMQLPLIDRAAVGGLVWGRTERHPSNAALIVLYLFDGNLAQDDGYVAGDVRVYCYPTAADQIPISMTLNRAHDGWVTKRMDAPVLIDAIADELRLMALETGKVAYCDNDECEALTERRLGKCRVCASALRLDDPEEDEEDEEDDEPEEEETEPDAVASPPGQRSLQVLPSFTPMAVGPSANFSLNRPPLAPMIPPAVLVVEPKK